MRARKCRAKLRATNDSWRVDETYITQRVAGQRPVDVSLPGSRSCWRYGRGHAPALTLSPTRDGQAAKRFFRKALRARNAIPPRVINVDKNRAYPKAVGKLKKKGTLNSSCEQRPVKYLNNLVEQAPRGYPRFIKRRVNPGLGLWSYETAWR